MADMGVENMVVDSASIERNAHRKRKKTDKLDTRKLLRKLVSYMTGDEEVWRVVVIPSEEDEARRRKTRELERLTKERKAHISRLKALLHTHGVKVKVSPLSVDALDEATLWNGADVPAALVAELRREYARLGILEDQIAEVRGELKEAVKEPANRADEVALMLTTIRGIALKGATTVSYEALGWRTFSNRKQAGSFTGLVNVPWDSGNSDRDLGISKVGNPRVRRILVQWAWLWLRYQPDSALTKWFNERFGGPGKRFKRVGIVALARRLFIALWRFVEQGIVPEGVIFKSKVFLR